MLNDAICFKAVYIVCGYTDLRSGMDRLAALIETQTGSRPYVPVPVADGGADDRPGEIGRASGTAGIYGITLCKTENFQGVFSTGKTVLPCFCGAVYLAVKRTGKGSGTPLFFF